MASGTERITRSISWGGGQPASATHNTYQYLSVLFFVLLTAILLNAGGFSGVIKSDYDDLVNNASVSIKIGNEIHNEVFTDENGNFNIEYKPNSINPNFNLPNKNVKINNPIFNKLNIFLEQKNNFKYTIFDITGRKLNNLNNITNGVYFLRIQENNKIISTHKFTNLNKGIKINEIIKPNNTKHSLNKTNSTDSLIVHYLGNDMILKKHTESINNPEGTINKNIILNRTLRTPNLNLENLFTNLDSLVTDSTYKTILSSNSQDYDANPINTKISNIIGEDIDSLIYSIENDTLKAIFNTPGNRTLTLTSTDANGMTTNKNINYNIKQLLPEFETYTIFTHKLFNGLGNPRNGLTFILKDSIKTNNDSGLVTFTFPKGTLNSTDSIEITDEILGTIQDGNGPFYKMLFPINTDKLNNNTIDSIQTMTDPMMLKNTNYWDNYVWTNQADREFYLTGPWVNIDPFNLTLLQPGTKANGRTHLFHHSPEHYSSNPPTEDRDYRLQTQMVIDTINYYIQDLAGKNKNPFTIVNVSGTNDSLKAINNGNIFDFSETNSRLKFVYFDDDYVNEISYIKNIGEYVDGNGASTTLRKIMAHELGRAVSYINLTPNETGKTLDIMSSGTGQLQPHDHSGFYFMLNAKPHFWRKIKNLRSIVPQSVPYWTKK